MAASGAPAMVESLQSGTLVTHERIATIADGIGVRVPVPEALQDLAGLVDDYVLVPDSSILTAMKLLAPARRDRGRAVGRRRTCGDHAGGAAPAGTDHRHHRLRGKPDAGAMREWLRD